MQDYCISKLQENTEELLEEVCNLHEKNEGLMEQVKQLEKAVQICELEKKKGADEMLVAFQNEKAALEACLREELLACQICMRNARNTVIMPCLHAQFCEECLEANKARNDRKCPTCRGPIRGMLPYIA
ncbi:hypothetical protein KP509_30G038100 [Ceratopteris richardii]|nr:hypothetical protein KP509_30G038100 [Ceratopteris richardii]